MWVIFLEAGVALALLLVIVWATRPRRPRAAQVDPGPQELAHPPEASQAAEPDDETTQGPRPTTKNDAHE